MVYPFIFMLFLQTTFVLGLVWFWMEHWEGSGRLPAGSWLVASIPVVTLAAGLAVGTHSTIITGTTPISMQIVLSISMTWLCYAIGAFVTLQEAQARRSQRSRA
jgi:hypothetical protein